jgi:2-dehydro-3-deoxyglucarate aldolase
VPAPRLKQLLSRGKTTIGMWVTLEAPSVTEIASTMGLDWVVIDAEHGALDFREIQEHLRATRGSATAPLVRIQEIEQGLIKRVLDLGAEGILVPQVRNAGDVAQAVRFAKYPPQGVRGIGAERATRWGQDIPARVRRANRETLVIPIIECVEAADDFEDILDVPGVDALFFGPHDFAASAGHPGVWNHPDVIDRILKLKKRADARGIPCGILSFGKDEGRLRKRQGFRMLAIGIDTVLMIRAAEAMMTALGRPVPPSVWNG